MSVETEENDLEFLDDETGVERGDSVLGRMLKTPPKEHKDLKKGQTKKEKPREATSPNDENEIRSNGS